MNTATQPQMALGDFTHLAEMYSLYRPSYAPTVLDAILGIVKKPVNTIDFADVGAGTGIWTRMVAARGCHSVVAVEPNAEMRKHGMNQSQHLAIEWREGSGEVTHLADESVDLISMASSFHWTQFDLSTKEFHRVLRQGGHFVALWNPRFIEDNPVLVAIEQKAYELAPNMQRISSGKSSFVNNLSQKLLNCAYFTDLTYLEGRHTAALTPQQYLGVWNSVNDIRAQMGEAVFKEFMQFIEQSISHLDVVNCTYLTRAWIMKKK